jgi:putative ABC transport system ATP-binding protein
MLYGQRKFSSKEIHARATRCLEMVSLGNRADHFSSQLSGGQQQRAAIARALVNDPQVILADEPTGNLDSKTSVEVMGVFQGLNEQGITIVMVTHELDIARFCKRNLVMRDGLLVSDTPVNDRFIATEELRRIRDAESAAKLTG